MTSALVIGEFTVQADQGPAHFAQDAAKLPNFTCPEIERKPEVPKDRKAGLDGYFMNSRTQEGDLRTSGVNSKTLTLNLNITYVRLAIETMNPATT